MSGNTDPLEKTGHSCRMPYGIVYKLVHHHSKRVGVCKYCLNPRMHGSSAFLFVIVAGLWGVGGTTQEHFCEIEFGE